MQEPWQPSGSVRRAEELARRMKYQSKQEVRGIKKDQLRIISEETDKMQEDMEKALRKGSDDKTVSLKLIRTRRETRVNIFLKGGLEETEEKLQKFYNAIISI